MKYQPLVGGEMSGHLGGIVASHNTYGSYFRKRVRPVNKKTAPQQEQRLAMQILSSTWRSLESGAQAAWIAAKLVKTSRAGQHVTLSGQAAWMFVNLVRQRIGLALIPLPPSSSEAVGFTVPTASFVAPDQLTLAFSTEDPWNAADGGVIISGSAPLGAGVRYCQAFSAVGTGKGPIAAPLVLTYPFSVQGSQTVRIRFHVSGPDGRQALPVDLDVTLAATATLVVNVQKVTALTALWVFDHAVTSDAAASPELTVDATAPTGTAQGGTNSVLCTYAAGHVVVGKPWSIAAAPTHITATPAIGYPESGLVV